MTAFEFMANAFCTAVGVVCLSAAALVATGAVIGIYRTAKRKK